MARVKARAKINLGLWVGGKRADGYHDLETVFYEVNLFDELSFEKKDGGGIGIITNKPEIPTDERNLVYRAAMAFFEEIGERRGVSIELVKNIPEQAGLGGGSSDAAAALLALCELFEKEIPKERLLAVAAKLGADVPFFLYGGTAHAVGIGEVLTPLPPLPPLPLVIVKPDFGISTKEAFLRIDKNGGGENIMQNVVQAVQKCDISGICQNIRNSFESVLMNPRIMEFKEALLREGAMGAAMTGSGSAVFGIFDSDKAARQAAGKLKSDGSVFYVSSDIQ